MFKVLTLLGTRPELIKMSRVIAELDARFEHVLVHSGQNYDYELNQVFFDELEIRQPDYFLGISAETPVQSIANVLTGIEQVIQKESPDAFCIYGDTNTGLAVLVAKKYKIPIFHMEAGNRCFDQRVPEEVNRKIIDHLSDINMVLSEQARDYLVAEGVKPETIIKTGSHMEEVLGYFADKIDQSSIVNVLSLMPDEFFLISLHREENVDSDEKIAEYVKILDALAEKYGFPVIVSTHPRTKKRIDSLGLSCSSAVQFHKPFGFVDYIKLQQSAFCVVSDSGTIMEEASLLNLAAVTIRDAHERPEGMEQDVLVISSMEKNHVLSSVDLVVKQRQQDGTHWQIVEDYRGGMVSVKIAKIISSYIPYIRRTVWHQN